MKKEKFYKKEPHNGYYWVEFEDKDNWLIFWFNHGYWQCCAMGRIELDDEDILSVDENKLHHKQKQWSNLR